MKPRYVSLLILAVLALWETPISAQKTPPPVGGGHCVENCGGGTSNNSGSSGGRGNHESRNSHDPKYDMAKEARKIGSTYYDRRMWGEAERAYREVLSYFPKWPPYHYDLGITLMQEKKYDEARSELEIALKGKEDRDDTWNALGVVEWHLGYYGKANDDFQKALALNPHNSTAQKNFSEIKLAMSADANGFNEAAADLVRTLLFAIDKMENKPPKGPPTNRDRVTLNCQDYFHAVGKQLSADGQPSWMKDLGGKNADNIVESISKDAEKPSGKRKWRRIEDFMPDPCPCSPEEIYRKAQELANQGIIVVGGMRKDKAEHGHVGIVVPIREGLDVSQFQGRGPFVRDGNEHRPGEELFASSWGAVKGSNAFKLSITSWYIWDPPSK